MKHTNRQPMTSDFGKTVHADIQRSTFMRNSQKKTTFDAGRLIPIYYDEILPGDTFEMDVANITRLATPLFPTMDTAYLDIYAFFVPNRLVWDGWTALCGENKSSAWTPSTKPALVPQFMQSGIKVPTVSIGDYYDLPYQYDLGLRGVSALPFRGYALIWNEWFRDENLQAPVVVLKGNTETFSSLYAPQYGPFTVNKNHDYFTSCLPAPQKGQSTLIPIQLNELIPVITQNQSAFNVAKLTGQQTAMSVASSSSPTTKWTGGLAPLVANGTGDLAGATGTPALLGGTMVPYNLFADGRNVNVSGSTISELRTAFQIQKLYEKDARGGTRYIEMLKAHFGVEAEDYRLQRPEFLGHHRTTIGMTQVPQTSSTVETSPQGNLAAFSYTANSGHFFRKSFVEHGYLHIFACVRQPKTYQNGIDRTMFRKDRFDFYYPTLAHISEQPVYTSEIYANTVTNPVFGYQEAWADYRYKPSKVSGQFRSGVPNSLDAWHYADYYDMEPNLSASWIVDNSKTNIQRTLAVNTQNQFICDFAFKLKASRPMPIYSIPGLVDHF